MDTSKIIMIGLVIVNIVFSISLAITSKGKGGWISSTLGWTVALLWILV